MPGKLIKKIKVIAGRLVKVRKLPLDRLGVYLPSLKLYQRVLSQKRSDNNKIYSLHERDNLLANLAAIADNAFNGLVQRQFITALYTARR